VVILLLGLHCSLTKAYKTVSGGFGWCGFANSSREKLLSGLTRLGTLMGTAIQLFLCVPFTILATDNYLQISYR